MALKLRSVLQTKPAVVSFRVLDIAEWHDGPASHSAEPVQIIFRGRMGKRDGNESQAAVEILPSAGKSHTLRR